MLTKIYDLYMYMIVDLSNSLRDKHMNVTIIRLYTIRIDQSDCMIRGALFYLENLPYYLENLPATLNIKSKCTVCDQN